MVEAAWDPCPIMARVSEPPEGEMQAAGSEGYPDPVWATDQALAVLSEGGYEMRQKKLAEKDLA